MEKFDNAYAQQWLMLALLHVITCIRMGKDYKPEEENNTAVQGVYLADSIIEAYHERFDSNEESESGSMVGQTVVNPSVASTVDALHKALAVEENQHGMASRLIDSTKNFEPAAKVFRKDIENPPSVKRPSIKR